jgi:RNA polymerase sigma-70 factor (ECF subfamily)
MVALRLDSRLSARIDASDVVQEALTVAAQRLADYERERQLPFYPWLHRLTSERLATVHRQHRRASRSVDIEQHAFAWADGPAPQRAGNEDAQDFLREAETIELDRVFPADPFAR